MKPYVVRSSIEELYAALQFWQRHAGLADWSITIDIRSADYFVDKESVGETTTRAASLEANILLLDPDGFGQDGSGYWGSYNMLDTLAHEVVHVMLWPLPRAGRKGLEHKLSEQTVERIARLLLRLWSSAKTNRG